MSPQSIVSVSSPTKNHFRNYDHVTWYVSNAKQAAAYFTAYFGFSSIAYMGLETGSRDICAQVIQCGKIVMVFKSCLRSCPSDPNNQAVFEDIQNFLAKHGDGVKDIAFVVDNVQDVYETAIAGGAVSAKPPSVASDKHGKVISATIKAYGDVTHTLINRDNYKGVFLPNYEHVSVCYAHCNLFGHTGFDHIDHCVANLGWDEMEKTCVLYEKAFGFHRFWSVDEKQVHTKYSALRSTVVASENEVIKMPINEPAEGLRHSQIEEFNVFNDGPGVQHVAFLTPNIIETVDCLRRRGVQFMAAPDSYYENLRERLKNSKVHILEAIDDIQRLSLLVDFDDQGYLLQIFTQPLTDRPSFFIEVIQRHNFDGFGAGNFKSLFEAIEKEQAARGTL